MEPRCAGRQLGVPAHDGQLHAPALHSCRLGVEAALPALRRRADRGRRLRQRLSCRRAPRRLHGLHVRNHRPREVRRREPPARGGQQHFPERRTAHLDRAERLRRHLPRRRSDPDRQGSRIAYGLGNRRTLRQAGVGGRRRGRGPCGGLCLRAEGLPGDDYPHGARSRRLCGGREDAKEQPDGRRAGDDSLHRRRAAAVEPRRAEPLYGDGARRVRLAVGRGDRAHRVPADRRFGPRPACQRRHGTSARRGALPRSGERRQRLHGGRLRRGSVLRTRRGGQCRPLGFGTARPVPLRPARRAGAHGVDRSAAHAFALSGRRLLLPDGAFPR